jgi:hypothetical protein
LPRLTSGAADGLAACSESRTCFGRSRGTKKEPTASGWNAVGFHGLGVVRLSIASASSRSKYGEYFAVAPASIGCQKKS